MINGFFRNGAGFVNAHLISEEMNIDETVEFLADTGASRTTLLDKDVICLGIECDKLRRYEQDMSGIGGSVETYVIDGALILFGEYAMEMPVFVIKHPHPIDHRRPTPKNRPIPEKPHPRNSPCITATPCGQ